MSGAVKPVTKYEFVWKPVTKYGNVCVRAYACVLEGGAEIMREEGREGGREKGKEGGKEEGRQAGMQAGRLGREGGMKGCREGDGYVNISRKGRGWMRWREPRGVSG